MYEEILEKLSHSTFRNRFKLKENDLQYIDDKGFDKIRQHAEDFIVHRLAPAFPSNDGKQTPMKGHPVFIAQHATASCCRQCLYKWHKIPPGRKLSASEQQYIVGLIMSWIKLQTPSS